MIVIRRGQDNKVVLKSWILGLVLQVTVVIGNDWISLYTLVTI